MENSRDNVICFEDYKKRKRGEDIEDFVMTMLESSGSLLEILRGVCLDSQDEIIESLDSLNREK